jgi:hypothetical protein
MHIRQFLVSGIQKIHNQLAYNIETFINRTKYIIDEITIKDLSMINDDMIIGLRFLQHSVQTTIIHDKRITFIPYQDNVPYISEVRKRGGTKQISNQDHMILLSWATCLSAGSELLLEIMGPGLVGGLLLPILSALPNALMERGRKVEREATTGSTAQSGG